MAKVVPPRPPKRAAKATWVEYIVRAHGVPRMDAKAATKAELISVCDVAEQDVEKPSTPSVEYGPVETATRNELAALHLDKSALAASAFVMAARVDDEQDVAAARELRMTLNVAKSLLAHTGSSPDDGDEADDSGVVVGPNRLEDLRKAAARAKPGR